MKALSFLLILPLCFALSSFSPAFSAEKSDEWTQSISLGLNVNKGNNDNTLYNGGYRLGRKRDFDKVAFQADFNYGKESKQVSVNNRLAKLQYNRQISGPLYWLANAGYEADEMADVDYRYTLGPGLGYGLIDNKKTELNLEAGATYIKEKFDAVAAQNDTALRVAELLEHKLSTSARLWQSIEYLRSFDDASDYLWNAELGVETTLTKSLKLKSLVQYTYNNTPALNKQEGDTSFMTMLVFNF